MFVVFALHCIFSNFALKIRWMESFILRRFATKWFRDPPSLFGRESSIEGWKCWKKRPPFFWIRGDLGNPKDCLRKLRNEHCAAWRKFFWSGKQTNHSIFYWSTAPIIRARPIDSYCPAIETSLCSPLFRSFSVNFANNRTNLSARSLTDIRLNRARNVALEALTFETVNWFHKNRRRLKFGPSSEIIENAWAQS